MGCVKRELIAVAGLSITSFLLWASLSGFFIPSIPIGINSEKEIHNALYGSQRGEITEKRWSAFGRSDLVKYDGIDYMDIFIDGTAGTPMYKFNGNFDDPNPAVADLKTSFPGYFPFRFLKDREKDTMLIIGSGGGRDVLLAAMGGVSKITAVEVNKDLVDIVRTYSRYNGGIYASHDNVSIIVDEGRSFLKRQKGKYDVIMLSLPVTNTSRSIEGYAMTENFLLTVDSIGDYLDHMTEEGRLIVIAHGDLSMMKLLSISLSALNKRGAADAEAMKQIYMVGSGQYPLFVLKKTPFTIEETYARYGAISTFGYDSSSSFFPYVEEAGVLNAALQTLGSGEKVFDDVEKKVEKLGYDISFVTDDRPFFYKFERGIPGPVLMVSWGAVGITLLVVLIPFMQYWRKEASHKKQCPKGVGDRRGNLITSIVLFFMLGAGFMLVEVSLAQRFVLFLGKPVLSLAVLLFSLLTGAGIGSLCSGRLASQRIMKGISMAALGIVGMLLIYNFIIPFIFGQLLGTNLIVRLSAAVIILTLLGFIMGFPFPLAIRLLKEMTMEKYIPWMWGVNGVSSVLGSALTVVVAIQFGFSVALFLGAGCYLVVFLLCGNEVFIDGWT